MDSLWSQLLPHDPALHSRNASSFFGPSSLEQWGLPAPANPLAVSLSPVRRLSRSFTHTTDSWHWSLSAANAQGGSCPHWLHILPTGMADYHSVTFCLVFIATVQKWEEIGLNGKKPCCGQADLPVKISLTASGHGFPRTGALRTSPGFWAPLLCSSHTWRHFITHM